MRLGELQELAASIGVSVPEKARRNDYIAAIREARQEGSAEPAGKKQGAKDRGEKQPAGKTKDSAESREDGAGRKDRSERSRSGEDQESKNASAPKNRSDQGHKDGPAGEDLAESADDRQAALDALSEAAARRAVENRKDEEEGGRRNRRNRRDRNSRRNRNDRGDRNERHDRRGADEGSDSDFNDTVREGDVLLKVAGILDIDGNNAYLRTAGYLPGPNDAYVSTQLIKRNKLRRGDAIIGAVRDLGESPNQGRGRQRHKYNPLVQIDSVNGLTLEDLEKRPEFGKLTPLYPNEMLRMETSPKAITPRVIDLVAPIGKGQRGLIVSPPKAGKTMIMQQIANAIAQNNPNVHLMVVLVDERPEEVTDMQRVVKGEVIASTFDRPANEHTLVAELAIERAKRLVELGQDVVVLLDSITRLGRAYNLAAPASGRILSGGVDAGALYPPKRFFGAARNIENGGSLTIVASALVETGSKMDEVIFEEFKGTGNMELRLSRQLADRRIFPAVDVNASGTRREELLFSPEELKIVWQLRRALGTLEVQESSDFLLGRIRKTESNGEFLMTIAKQMSSAKSGE